MIGVLKTIESRESIPFDSIEIELELISWIMFYVGHADGVPPLRFSSARISITAIDCFQLWFILARCDCFSENCSLKRGIISRGWLKASAVMVMRLQLTRWQLTAWPERQIAHCRLEFLRMALILNHQAARVRRLAPSVTIQFRRAQAQSLSNWVIIFNKFINADLHDWIHYFKLIIWNCI